MPQVIFCKLDLDGELAYNLLQLFDLPVRVVSSGWGIEYLVSLIDKLLFPAADEVGLTS